MRILYGEMAKHGGAVRSISCLKNNARLLLTASDDQLLNTNDLGSGNSARTCRGHEGLVLSAAGSDDSDFIVSGGVIGLSIFGIGGWGKLCIHVRDTEIRFGERRLK